jgi:succinyl-CoA synthetase alpha subunit
MATGYLVKKNEYYDSVFLMRAAKNLAAREGILDAVALMGTEKNKELLADFGAVAEEIAAATPGDLIVALRAASQEALADALADVDAYLHPAVVGGRSLPARTLGEALSRRPHSNLAVISVPGAYAAREAKKALESGLNVFLFSDNVAVDSERSLKEYARERGLIVMGPDCGTALIAGTGFGFANVVRRGSIGVIGASGTGLQEFTVLVHRAGSGISHAIGVGSRDLSDAVGGLSTLAALDALESDSQTQVVAILSKPPGALVLESLAPRVLRCRKAIIVCFLGVEKDRLPHPLHDRAARTLSEAAASSVEMVTGKRPSYADFDPAGLQELVARERENMRPEQKYIRGVFAGGTFCYQAQQVLRDAGIAAYSNSPTPGNKRLPGHPRSEGHAFIDMGSGEFTLGRPHPMIDSGLRRQRILAEAEDPGVRVLLLDFVLGFNSSSDPAGDLLPSIEKAKYAVKMRGGHLSVVASVCGTEEDPQGFRRQVERLAEAGCVVFSHNAGAAEFCARLLNGSSAASHGK